ncbi:hypothetical protein [Nodosilinea nodulosa]|uniref:hypothetical protein n=1 Tax=Nodosilinea nodulosa TaxID=416001 RepID=UPI0012D82A2F|nr:hypothetical protein [Nodosilinea nodulosa]
MTGYSLSSDPLAIAPRPHPPALQAAKGAAVESLNLAGSEWPPNGDRPLGGLSRRMVRGRGVIQASRLK